LRPTSRGRHVNAVRKGRSSKAFRYPARLAE
jgi:hypothetical protein